MSNANVKGKSVFITGGAHGIGRAITCALAGAGAHIGIHYNRSGEEAMCIRKEIQDKGGVCTLVQGDFEHPENAEKIFTSACDSLGHIDILINNASVFSSESFDEFGLEDAMRHCSVNALSPFFISRRFATQQHTQKERVIINMVDTRVHARDRLHYPYHLSKRMLLTMTKDMANEFAPDIRVNAIAPGLIVTDASQKHDYYARLARRYPLGRYGTQDDILQALWYLLGARCVTGQVIYVDAGAHLNTDLYG